MRALPFCVAPAMVVLAGLAFAADIDQPRKDAYGDALPESALFRLGTARFRGEFGGRIAMLSPDGKLLALPGGGGICLRDAATGKEVQRIKVPGMDLAWATAEFSSDGKLLAVSDGSKTVLCDVGKGVELGTIDAADHLQYCFLSFSQDAKVLTVAGENHLGAHFILIWDVAARKRVITFPIPITKGFALALSPDGKVLATWDSLSKHLNVKRSILEFWDTATGKKLRTLKLNARSIDCAVFSPDGKRLLVSTNGSILSVHDVATGARLSRFAGRRGGGAMLRYSSDGKLLAAGSLDGVVQLWDPGTGKRIGQCEGPPRTRLSSIVFLPGNKVLASGVSGQTARIWEVPSGRERTPQGGHLSSATTLAFSRDGKTLLSGGADSVRLWQTMTGKEGRRFDLPLGPDDVPAYQLSPDGRHLIWGVQENLGLRVIDVHSGKEIAELDAQSDMPVAYASNVGAPTVYRLPAAFAPHGNIVVTLHINFNKDRSFVRLWDLTTGQQRRKFKIGEAIGSPFLALSSGAKVLAVLGNYSDSMRRLSLWDVANGKPIAIRVIMDDFSAATFSPNGGLLATLGDARTILLLDAAEGTEVAVLEGTAERSPHALAFSPDGRTLAVASDGEKDGAVVLWELASGKVRATFAAPRSLALAFSPDGRILATSGSDTTVTLWDAIGRTGPAARKKEKTKPAELAALWADLDSADAAKAHRSMARLTAAPVEALALLKKELKPAAGKPLAESEVKRLIGELAGDSFEGREKAGKALKTGGRFLRPALLAALQASTNLEQKRRLRELLRGLVASRPGPEMLRPTRALEVLERLSTREARRLLQTLAKGNPAARLTEDAVATLKRMTP